MTMPLATIAGPVRHEIVVTKSRFIADVAPASSIAEADAVVAGARKEFWDARHHCSALVIGPDGDTARSNDDGEPAGTAGAPMLAVLRGSGLTDVVAVVTRYFGGTLLGAGGLVRAYGRAVSSALELARRLDRVAMALHDVVVPVADAGRAEHVLRRWLDDVGGTMDDVRYTGADATFAVSAPVDAAGPDAAGPDAGSPVRVVLARAGLPATVEDRGTAIRDVPAP